MATRPIGGTDTQIALGRLFREAREAAGMTLRQVSDAMGMSINTIRWHEAGTRCLRADDLVVAARLMGTNARRLIADPPDASEALGMLAAALGEPVNDVAERLGRHYPADPTELTAYIAGWAEIPADEVWKRLKRPLPKRTRKPREAAVD